MPTITSKSPQQLVNELRDLVVTYAKQETVDPLRSLGRYVALGLAGSLLLAVGGIFLTLGVLRLLQSETGGVFDGGWSFAPYLITLALAGLVIGIMAMLVIRTKSTHMGSRS